jgi:hypothetical protein
MTPNKPDATEAAENAAIDLACAMIGIDWRATNSRRSALIQKKVARTITDDERDELNKLQSLASARQNILAPLPLEQLEAMHEAAQSPTYAEQSAELAELRAKLAAVEKERDDLLDSAAKLGQQVCRDKPRRDRLAKYDDATPINEAFCEANGATLTAGYARTWKFPCGVEVIFGVGRFEVYLGDVLLETVTTCGQLLHLLDGLGVRA